MVIQLEGEIKIFVFLENRDISIEWFTYATSSHILEQFTSKRHSQGEDNLKNESFLSLKSWESAKPGRE